MSVSTTERTDGFNVSTNNGIVVGFSLTGDVINPGNGPIVVVTVSGDSAGSASACLSDVIISDPNGQAMNPSSSCGDFVITEEPVDPIVLIVGDGGSSIGSSGLLEVSMDNNEAIGGFQFALDISPSIANISQITTTDRTVGFTVSTANGIVVGFSLTGDVIQPGSGPIINVEMLGESGGNAEVCLDNIVLSDPSGLALPSISECGSDHLAFFQARSSSFPSILIFPAACVAT